MPSSNSEKYQLKFNFYESALRNAKYDIKEEIEDYSGTKSESVKNVKRLNTIEKIELMEKLKKIPDKKKK